MVELIQCIEVLDMQRVLVTGGAGFIGSHLIEKLSVKKGFEVIAFDNLSIGSHNVKFLKSVGVDPIIGDIVSTEDLTKINGKIDIIIHLAAMNRAPRSIKNPVKSNAVNITGTVNLLEFARKHDSKFVFASSSSVFGYLETMPRPEETYEFKPSHPYGLGKMTSEHYCRLYREHYNLDTKTIRYFAVFGPRQSPKLTYSAVIPKFVEAAINDKPITIFGGSQSRNFTFVKDSVRATLLVALADKTKHNTYQIAGNEEISINKLADLVEEISGKKIIRKTHDHQPGDIFKSIPEMSHIVDEFQYKPKNTFLEALKETYNWFKDNQNYFK